MKKNGLMDNYLSPVLGATLLLGLGPVRIILGDQPIWLIVIVSLALAIPMGAGCQYLFQNKLPEGNESLKSLYVVSFLGFFITTAFAVFSTLDLRAPLATFTALFALASTLLVIITAKAKQKAKI